MDRSDYSIENKEDFDNNVWYNFDIWVTEQQNTFETISVIQLACCFVQLDDTSYCSIAICNTVQLRL